MLHLYQKTVRNCPRDFHVVSGEPRRHDLSQRCQLIVVDVVDLAFGEAEQKDCSGVPHHPPKTPGAALTEAAEKLHQPRSSCGCGDPIGLNEEIGRDFPTCIDLLDHLKGKDIRHNK
jgi:hypothetical protein